MYYIQSYPTNYWLGLLSYLFLSMEESLLLLLPLLLLLLLLFCTTDEAGAAEAVTTDWDY